MNAPAPAANRGMAPVETAEHQACAVEGWLSVAEGRLLFRLARQCTGHGAIVEIGSWKGKSTIWLAHGSRAGSRLTVHAIDPHTGSPQHHEMWGQVWTFNEFRQNIKAAGMDDLVEPHVDFSDAVARTFDQPVELIFIDGLHEYEGVKADFDAWFPKVIDGGWMAFHDSTCWPGVQKVVTEELFRSRRFRKIRFSRSIAYGQKVASNTAWERFENGVALRVFLAHAALDRFVWRLLHRYLDCEATRAAIRYAKKRLGRSPGPAVPDTVGSGASGSPNPPADGL